MTARGKALADRAVRFVSALPHTRGEWAGKPFQLAKWQTALLRKLFGTLRADGQRQYRTAYVEIPRKNGKTELAAALALYLLIADDEPGAEVYGAAVDREQASLVFHAAERMVELEPELAAVLEVIPSQRRIVHRASGSVYRAIPGDAPSAHGYNAHAVIYDELHAAPNRELWDVLTTSTGSRRQPLTIAITTAGYDRHSICWELHEYALKVRAGVITAPEFLPILYGADPADDWTDPAVWARANPNLGVSLKREYMEQECRRAQEILAYQNTFKRLHLNLWTEQATRAIEMPVWDACAAPVTLDDYAGRPCFGGLDLASRKDLAALVLVFPQAGGYAVLPRFWIPADNIAERVRRDRVPYDLWVQQGFITTTPGNIIDQDFIRRDINALHERVDIREIAIDRWNGAQITTQLMGDGFTMVEFGQGFASMANPTKEFLALLPAGRLAHGGHPVLRWMASNLAVNQDAAGNMKPDKEASGEKIDGIVAAIMGLARALATPDPTSVYDRRGVVVL